MCKRLIFLTSVVLVLGLFGSNVASASTVWNPAANGIVPPATGNWGDAANWTNGLPDAVEKAVFNVPDAAECLVVSPVSGFQLVQGDGADGGVIRVQNGGSLTTKSVWSAVGYNSTAHMIVETGGSVSFGQHSWIGFKEGAVGTVDINGGVVNVAEMFGLGWSGGDGYVNVNDGGLLALSNIHGDGVTSIKQNSLLSINGTGMVTLPGDFGDVIDAYAEAGLIAGDGVLGAVQAVVADDVTTVTAVPSGVTVTVEAGGDIAAANALAQTGDTVDIAAGTFVLAEQIEIKDGVTYKGAGPDLTIIDGNNVTRAFAAWGDRGANNGQVDANGVGIPNITGPIDWVIDGLTIQNCVSDAANRQDILGAARDLLNNYTGTPYTLATAQAENGGVTDNPGWFDILSGSADDDLTDVELQAYLDGNPPGSAGHIVVNGDKDDDGGAVSLNNGAAGTIRNCAFSNNTAVDKGGAIEVNGGAAVAIQNCTFSNISADDDGGAIAVDSQDLAVSIENCAFNSCSALGDDGGALYFSGNASTYIVTDTNFTDCTTKNDGGAVKADGSDSSITFSNCTFSNISADDDGGAIALSADGQDVSIENCAFNSCSNNAGDDGGAVYMSSEGSTYTFTDTTFTGCISDDDAGVAYCSGSDSTFAFSNCTFDLNTCKDEGGAVKVGSPGSTVTFTDTIFTENYAGDDAGAAHITGDDANYVLTGCSFIGNTCNDDWAALRYNPDRAELTMTNCAFIGNGIDADGVVVGDDSVLGFDDDDAGPSTISNCLIAYNACNDDWIMELKAAFSLLNCTFIGNASNDSSKSMIGVRGRPWDSTGDAVDDVVTDVSIISNCLFINNATQNSVIGDTYTDVFAPTVINCLFYGNLDDGSPAANTDDNSPEVGTIDVSAVTDAAQIVVDPAGDYHLVAGSPAIDASDPATATATDIEGTPAVGVRDVGAYELSAN